MKVSCKRTDLTVKTREMTKKFVYCVVILLALWSSGCAGTTTFTAYPSKINPLISNLQLKQPIDFNQCLISECQSKDSILYDFERGRLAQILGNTDMSMRDFAASMDKIKENDEKARVSLPEIGAGVAATVTNDNAIPYEGEGYERVMLHHYQALNYLVKKDLEGAGVEVRRANAEQEDALKRHEQEVEEARQKAEKNNVENLLNNENISQNYAQMDELAGKVKNSFQNAYTFYLSGFIYEMLKQPNDAYIDYKKALEIYPENIFLQKDVMRLAKTLDMGEDLKSYEEKYKLEAPSIPAQNGDVLVIFEDGFAPQKQEVKIPLPIPKVGLLAAAFPVYRENSTSYYPLSISQDGEQLGTTETICDFRALSVMSLKEKIPVIATRQIVRLIAKGATSKLAKDKFGILGELTASAYNFLSENADLRSWVTLPANAQILRMSLPAGMHKLVLSQKNLPTIANVDLDINEGGKAIIHVVRAGLQLYTSVISFPTNLSALSITATQEHL